MALHITPSSTPSDTGIVNFLAGSVTGGTYYSISGNAGVAYAVVSYSGSAIGSVAAHASGNFSVTGLSNGAYTITPSLSGCTFSPTSKSETISGANVSGVNFTASEGPVYSGWSPQDSRKHKPNSATYRVLNGAQIFDVETSSNPAVPGTDSRKEKPVASALEYPQNSCTAPPFKG